VDLGADLFQYAQALSMNAVKRIVVEKVLAHD
jgi:hypothetical protein